MPEIVLDWKSRETDNGFEVQTLIGKLFVAPKDNGKWKCFHGADGLAVLNTCDEAKLWAQEYYREQLEKAIGFQDKLVKKLKKELARLQLA